MSDQGNSYRASRVPPPPPFASSPGGSVPPQDPSAMPPPVPGTGMGAARPAQAHEVAYSPPQAYQQQSPLGMRLPERSAKVAYAWLFFFGFFGGHQFYLGRTGRGVAYIFTFAFFGIGWFIDVITLPRQVAEANARQRGPL